MAAATFAGCGITKAPTAVSTPPPVTANLLSNPGFEQGDLSWQFKDQPEWSAFSIGDTGRTGVHSLHLQLHGDDAATGTHIAGALTTITPKDFPDYVSGFYRVDDWHPSTTFQYLQFVVAVHGDFGGGSAIQEMRFPIAGIDREPFMLSNARFLFLSRGAPALRQWTYFGYPLKQAFASRLGAVPTTWTSIDIFFEVRYDGKTADQPATSADVSFDDLYAGPQISNPNHPPAL